MARFSVAAALMCKKPVFWRFLAHRVQRRIRTEAHCIAALYQELGIKTRRELDDPARRESWVMLISAFNVWAADRPKG